MSYRKFVLQLSALLAASLISSVSVADHAWGKYKWKPSSIPFNLDLVDNVNSDWDGHLLSVSTDWSVSTVLGTTIGTGSTDPASCSPESGNVQVCNYTYGDTGWLGIAQIYGRGTTIRAGVAKLNDTYYNAAPGTFTTDYNTLAWRQMVMCQEIAHTFGLSHQDETFNNVNLGSCMDYTNDPDGSLYNQLSNVYPNQHDYVQLEKIYDDSKGGKDDGDGGGCNPKSPKCNPGSAPNVHAQWGRLVSGPGGIEVYERILANGYKVITHVTWTLEHAKNHSH